MSCREQVARRIAEFHRRTGQKNNERHTLKRTDDFAVIEGMSRFDQQGMVCHPAVFASSRFLLCLGHVFSLDIHKIEGSFQSPVRAWKYVFVRMWLALSCFNGKLQRFHLVFTASSLPFCSSVSAQVGRFRKDHRNQHRFFIPLVSFFGVVHNTKECFLCMVWWFTLTRSICRR